MNKLSVHIQDNKKEVYDFASLNTTMDEAGRLVIQKDGEWINSTKPNGIPPLNLGMNNNLSHFVTSLRNSSLSFSSI